MTKLVTITTPGGARFTVAKPYAKQFQGLFNDIEGSGYKIKGDQSGGYNKRNIAGTNTPSQHSFGKAVDLNWTDQPRGAPGTIPGDLARDLAAKYGLTWGGDWNNPDPMHFEIARSGATPMGGRGLTSYAGLGGPQPTPPAGTQAAMPAPFKQYQNSAYIPEASLANQLRHANQAFAPGRATSLMGALAEGLKGGARGYFTGEANKGLQGNQGLESAAYSAANDATTTGEMQNAFANSGVPSMQKQGLAMKAEQLAKSELIQQRKAAADQYGLNPGTPGYNEYVLTGKYNPKYAGGASGVEYGKTGVLMHDGRGNWSAIRWGADGTHKVVPLQTPPPGVDPNAPPGPLRGPDGQPVQVPLDIETGEATGSQIISPAQYAPPQQPQEATAAPPPPIALQPKVPLKEVDRGLTSDLIDPFSGQPVTTVDKGVEGKTRVEAETKADVAHIADLEKKYGKEAGMVDTVKEDIRIQREALNDIRKFKGQDIAGLIGSMAAMVPGTDAYTVRQKLLTLQAGAGFGRLAQMRQNSPTGGALGAINKTEMDLLIASKGTLAQGLKSGQFWEALDKYDATLGRAVALVEDSFNRTYAPLLAKRSGRDVPANAIKPKSNVFKTDDGKFEIEVN